MINTLSFVLRLFCFVASSGGAGDGVGVMINTLSFVLRLFCFVASSGGAGDGVGDDTSGEKGSGAVVCFLSLVVVYFLFR
jgi:hypothetical protein